MNVSERQDYIEDNLRFILDEMRRQPHVSATYSSDCMSFEKQMSDLDEWICPAGEYGIAYESIVATLEKAPFMLTGKASIKLLEVGLLLKFKTDRDEDKEFDSRVIP